MTPFNNHLIISKIFIILYHSWLLLCKYPLQPVCTFFLHIPAYIIIIKSTVYYSAHYFIAYFIFYFIIFYFLFLLFIFYTFFSSLYLCIFSCVYISYNFTVHGADLTYISLLIIFCIIVYVTNTNLESWAVVLGDFLATQTLLLTVH